MLSSRVSVDTMFTGTRTYNQAVRVYKILYEAFLWILLKRFERAYPGQTEAMQNLLENFDDSSDFNRLASSEELQDYCTDLITFKDKLADESMLGKFWLSFLEMSEVLLNVNVNGIFI